MTDFAYKTEGRNMQAASWHNLIAEDWANWGDSQWRGCHFYVMGATISISVSSQNVTKIKLRAKMSLNLHYHTTILGIIIVGGTAFCSIPVMNFIISKIKMNRSYKNRLNKMPISGFKLTGIPPPNKERLVWQTYIMAI